MLPWFFQFEDLCTLPGSQPGGFVRADPAIDGTTVMTAALQRKGKMTFHLI
jgi:hypothetical protein